MLGRQKRYTESRNIPLRQNVNRLLAKDEGRIVYNGGRINSMFGNGNLSVVEYFNYRQKPREKRYL